MQTHGGIVPRMDRLCDRTLAGREELSRLAEDIPVFARQALDVLADRWTESHPWRRVDSSSRQQPQVFCQPSNHLAI